MSEEELEETGILKRAIRNLEEEEMTIDEMIEEFLEKVDYLDMDIKKKERLKESSIEIQKEKDPKVKEYLFKILKKEANE